MAQTNAAPVSLSPDDILKTSPAGDWQALDPANTLVMTLPSGRVIISLAPDFAPKSIANIKALVRQKYFDNSAIVRAQDDYVVQWSQGDAMEKTMSSLKGYAEFERPTLRSFVRLPDPDTYAPQVGFDGNFPAASDGNSEWLTHCYGMVGVGRDSAPDSGTGVELYAVIGQAPRHLDRNITLVGRVVEGIEHFSTLPRGIGPLGFYEKPGERTRVASLRLASELASLEQPRLEILKTSSATFTAYVAARRNRSGWFVRSAGHIDVCNIPLPARSISR
jgi:peptidylprolyl isomerase